MEFQFRTALNGFNRSDVVVYLQHMKEAHKAAMLNAQTEASRNTEELARLRQENEALRAELAALKAQPKAEEKPSMQQEELEAYRRAMAMEKEITAKLAAAEKETAEKLAATEKETTERLAAAEKEIAEKMKAAELESAEKIAKAKDALNQIQEKVNAMTAFLAEASTSLKEL